jgi:hypothetical protein
MLCVALAALLGLARPAAAQPAGAPVIAGRWTGAKLRCQKEEGKLVRCGTPAPFEITFTAEGTGTTPDESLPKSFAWRWLGEKEIGLTPSGGGEELKLFGVEADEGTLTFQAYVFLPTSDPNVPAEARYIHYVFDVTPAK